MTDQRWYPFDGGRTIGTEGSEQGTILRDEEYSQSARITLEQCKHVPFAITCGIYGWMFHTVFASSREEAETVFEAMKERLAAICDAFPTEDDPRLDAKVEETTRAIEAFVRDF